MAQQVKVPAAKPDDLSSNSQIYMVEGENQLLKVSLWPSLMLYGVCMPVHACECTQ